VRPLAFIAFLLTLWIAAALAQPAATARTYDVQESYQIYSLLLPYEQSYGVAKGTLVIQQETVSRPDLLRPCLTPEAFNQFKDAIADYNHINRKPWLLQRRFQIEKPYEIVSSQSIGASLQANGWEGFYRRYPDSGGYLVTSAVGFDKARNRAVVYTGSSCNNLCGHWRFHLLERLHGEWKEITGVTCVEVSFSDPAPSGFTS
jgi:hypothetical protein